jgi:amino-acid N-acetyltransferase
MIHNHQSTSTSSVKRLRMNIREASEKEDLDRVFALLLQASLPTDGVKEHFRNFLVAEDREGTIIGAIGMELYPDGTGLLRSAVVEPSSRNSGIGSLLYRELIDRARRTGIKRLVLLTTTAEKYFERKGFRTTPRSSIKGPVTESAEFVGACPETAICMEMMLEY